MAQMIPQLSEIQIEDIPSKAEQRVYQALERNIPNSCLVVHSLEFIKENYRNHSHSDREADFVIFSPELGVLVIEVKGGGIEYDKKTTQWYSIDRYNNKHDIKNPVKQAKDAKYEIARHLSREIGNKKVVIAHCALFPDVLDTKPLASADMPVEILGGGEDLRDVSEWVNRVFAYWQGKDRNHEKLGVQGVRAAENIFGKDVSVRPSLKLIIEQENEVQLNLTKQQKNILRQLKKRKQAIIEGGAGTGKTILALEHGIELGEQGLSVLLLCYNKCLGNSLKKKAENASNIHAMSFHEFCSWRIRQAKADTGRDLINESNMVYPNEDKYDVLMPDALMNSIDISPISYDVVIVDEGQDFKDEYWLAIEQLLEQEEDHNFYIFHDSNQAIYTSLEQLPINTEPLYLLDNCRNTSPIHDLAYKFYNGIEIDPPQLEGEQATWLSTGSSLSKQATEISSLVNKLIQVEKISPLDISVITIGSFVSAQSLLSKSKHAHYYGFKGRNNCNHVLVDTAKRFKGLESKLLILWILDEHEVSDSLLYVAISRARLRLWVACDKSVRSSLEK
ncbi:NERD domain-containing protein [Vibrio natriegens]|uniref:NERD domain-containing protein n=1 Tax=Vibrio natriegens TaxID=691 RepID=UPI003F8365F4